MSIMDRRVEFQKQVAQYRERVRTENIADQYGVRGFRVGGIEKIDDGQVIFVGHSITDDLSNVIINFNDKTIKAKQK